MFAGTFKMVKTHLQRQGLEPGEEADRLFVLLPSEGYVPLTAERRRALEAGQLGL